MAALAELGHTAIMAPITAISADLVCLRRDIAGLASGTVKTLFLPERMSCFQLCLLQSLTNQNKTPYCLRTHNVITTSTSVLTFFRGSKALDESLWLMPIPDE
jgi:hypothetical protein